MCLYQLNKKLCWTVAKLRKRMFWWFCNRWLKSSSSEIFSMFLWIEELTRDYYAIQLHTHESIDDCFETQRTIRKALFHFNIWQLEWLWIIGLRHFENCQLNGSCNQRIGGFLLELNHSKNGDEKLWRSVGHDPKMLGVGSIHCDYKSAQLAYQYTTHWRSTGFRFHFSLSFSLSLVHSPNASIW